VELVAEEVGVVGELAGFERGGDAGCCAAAPNAESKSTAETRIFCMVEPPPDVVSAL